MKRWQHAQRFRYRWQCRKPSVLARIERLNTELDRAHKLIDFYTDLEIEILETRVFNTPSNNNSNGFPFRIRRVPIFRAPINACLLMEQVKGTDIILDGSETMAEPPRAPITVRLIKGKRQP